jgi:hypothetical protein
MNNGGMNEWLLNVYLCLQTGECLEAVGSYL